jgi:hypothetical protein
MGPQARFPFAAGALRTRWGHTGLQRRGRSSDPYRTVSSVICALWKRQSTSGQAPPDNHQITELLLDTLSYQHRHQPGLPRLASEKSIYNQKWKNREVP